MSNFKIEIPVRIKLALNKLHEAGHEAYVVGGCVRDIFLGKEPDDWDITTSAIPEEIQKVFGEYKQIDTGIRHGTVMVIVGGEMVEITTYRIDGQYSDGRRPDNVSFTTNIIEDLARRDYTINACAITDSLIIDPFGGQEDAKNRLIRCVGSPTQRLTEDALRILRGIRFASVLNFKVEENTKRAMLECKNLLKNVSQERITAEFCKMLLGINVYDTLIQFKDILVCILPEIEEMIGCEQNNKYHIYDVYQHSLKAVESIDRDVILRATMFFHDIAKPHCCSIDPQNVQHFYGHSEISAQMTQKILKRMKFSNRDTDTITELIKYHDTQIGLNSKSVKKLLSKLGEVQLRRLLKVKRADAIAQNPSFISGTLENLDIVEQILNHIIVQTTCISVKDLAISGHDLIRLGIPEGKQIGVILNKLLEMIFNEELENNKNDLLDKVKSDLSI
jgi:tRNA nucleotidyltransferase (CCA-adding enzyme)